jgi:hypothetical protein
MKEEGSVNLTASNRLFARGYSYKASMTITCSSKIGRCAVLLLSSALLLLLLRIYPLSGMKVSLMTDAPTLYLYIYTY